MMQNPEVSYTTLHSPRDLANYLVALGYDHLSDVVSSLGIDGSVFFSCSLSVLLPFMGIKTSDHSVAQFERIRRRVLNSDASRRDMLKLSGLKGTNIGIGVVVSLPSASGVLSMKINQVRTSILPGLGIEMGNNDNPRNPEIFPQHACPFPIFKQSTSRSVFDMGTIVLVPDGKVIYFSLESIKKGRSQDLLSERMPNQQTTKTRSSRMSNRIQGTVDGPLLQLDIRSSNEASRRSGEGCVDVSNSIVKTGIIGFTSEGVGNTRSGGSICFPSQESHSFSNIINQNNQMINNGDGMGALFPAEDLDISNIVDVLYKVKEDGALVAVVVSKHQDIVSTRSPVHPLSMAKKSGILRQTGSVFAHSRECSFLTDEMIDSDPAFQSDFSLITSFDTGHGSLTGLEKGYTIVPNQAPIPTISQVGEGIASSIYQIATASPGTGNSSFLTKSRTVSASTSFQSSEDESDKTGSTIIYGSSNTHSRTNSKKLKTMPKNLGIRAFRTANDPTSRSSNKNGISFATIDERPIIDLSASPQPLDSITKFPRHQGSILVIRDGIAFVYDRDTGRICLFNTNFRNGSGEEEKAKCFQFMRDDEISFCCVSANTSYVYHNASHAHSAGAVPPQQTYKNNNYYYYGQAIADNAIYCHNIALIKPGTERLTSTAKFVDKDRSPSNGDNLFSLYSTSDTYIGVVYSYNTVNAYGFIKIVCENKKNVFTTIEPNGKKLNVRLYEIKNPKNNTSSNRVQRRNYSESSIDACFYSGDFMDKMDVIDDVDDDAEKEVNLTEGDVDKILQNERRKRESNFDFMKSNPFAPEIPLENERFPDYGQDIASYTGDGSNFRHNGASFYSPANAGFRGVSHGIEVYFKHDIVDTNVDCINLLHNLVLVKPLWCGYKAQAQRISPSINILDGLSSLRIVGYVAAELNNIAIIVPLGAGVCVREPGDRLDVLKDDIELLTYVSVYLQRDMFYIRPKMLNLCSKGVISQGLGSSLLGKTCVFTPQMDISTHLTNKGPLSFVSNLNHYELCERHQISNIPSEKERQEFNKAFSNCVSFVDYSSVLNQNGDSKYSVSFNISLADDNGKLKAFSYKSDNLNQSSPNIYKHSYNIPPGELGYEGSDDSFIRLGFLSINVNSFQCHNSLEAPPVPFCCLTSPKQTFDVPFFRFDVLSLGKKVNMEVGYVDSVDLLAQKIYYSNGFIINPPPSLTFTKKQTQFVQRQDTEVLSKPSKGDIMMYTPDNTAVVFPINQQLMARTVYVFKDTTKQLSSYYETSALNTNDMYLILGITTTELCNQQPVIYVFQPVTSSGARFWMTPGVTGLTSFSYTMQSQFLDKKPGIPKSSQGCCCDFNYAESRKNEIARIKQGQCIKDGDFLYSGLAPIEELKGRNVYILPSIMTCALQEQK